MLPIAPETVRRWLRGVSVPELHRFRSLCAFLGGQPAELAYLLLLYPDHAVTRQPPGHGYVAHRDGRGQSDLREALHQLVSKADGEVLSAAYMAFLIAPGLSIAKATTQSAGPGSVSSASGKK